MWAALTNRTDWTELNNWLAVQPELSKLAKTQTGTHTGHMGVTSCQQRGYESVRSSCKLLTLKGVGRELCQSHNCLWFSVRAPWYHCRVHTKNTHVESPNCLHVCYTVQCLLGMRLQTLRDTALSEGRDWPCHLEPVGWCGRGPPVGLRARLLQFSPASLQGF